MTVDTDGANVNTEVATDEETKVISSDEISDAKDLNENIENKTDLPENSDKEDNKNEDYVAVDETKKSEKGKEKKIRTAKGVTVTAVSAAATGVTVAVTKNLLKSSGDGKKEKQEPIPPDDQDNSDSQGDSGSDSKEKNAKDEKPLQPSNEEEKNASFATWYKSNRGLAITLTILALYIFQAIVRIVYLEINQRDFEELLIGREKPLRRERSDIRPFFGLWKSFTNDERFDKHPYNENYYKGYRGFKRIGINAIAAFTLAKYSYERGPLNSED